MNTCLQISHSVTLASTRDE